MMWSGLIRAGILAVGLMGPAQAVDLPTLASLQWVARPIVIFADSAADPRVEQQVRMLDEGADMLADRDVQIFVDTDPAARSAMRTALRPRGFTVVLIGKDGEVKFRKPRPVKADEFSRLIDRMPMRRQEMLDRGETVRP